MSFAHLRLNKSLETTVSVEYLAVSPDFSKNKTWEPVARIVIDKSAHDYEFIPINEWASIDLAHPKLYGLSDDERKAKLHVGASCGAWTGRIHAWTVRLIEANTYPSTYPS
jgi:hypothetical protein